MGTHVSNWAPLLLIGLLLVSAVRTENVRIKRETNDDCADKYKTIPEHSMCLAKSSGASNSGVSASEKTEIVDLHNKFRAIPGATNMLKLEWDDEIASIAQHWADVCTFVHESGARRSIPGTYDLGQNLAMDAKNWSDAINMWYNEVNFFTYGVSDNFHSVGHYTQVVWANTHRVGCGYTDCPGKKYFVCNYGPGGNLGDFSKPFKRGGKCGECPGCTANLCDCPNPCLNGGTLFRNNCTCTCKHDFYVTSSQCALNCDATTDPDYCSGDYGNENDCSAIATDCPNRCHVCPYSDPNYTEGSVEVVKRTDEGDGTAAVHCDVITVITMATILAIKLM